MAAWMMEKFAFGPFRDNGPLPAVYQVGCSPGQPPYQDKAGTQKDRLKYTRDRNRVEIEAKQEQISARTLNDHLEDENPTKAVVDHRVEIAQAVSNNPRGSRDALIGIGVVGVCLFLVARRFTNLEIAQAARLG